MVCLFASMKMMSTLKWGDHNEEGKNREGAKNSGGKKQA